MQLWVGTSGYSYSDWVGPFYPAGTRGGAMLEFYSRHFPLVELNFSYYRLPTPQMLARHAEQVPPGFKFVVKVPRTISHEENPRDIEPFRQAVAQMQERDCLLGVLCQLPQAAHQTAARWRWLQSLFDAFAGLDLALEFRHRSWVGPEVAQRLGEAGVDLVAVDVPDLPNLYPRGLVHSTGRVYVRLHSRLAANWYPPAKNRYDYDYKESEMTEWLDALAASQGQIQRVLMLFNNCHRAQAVANAASMQKLVRNLAAGFELAPQPAALPHQRFLFD